MAGEEMRAQLFEDVDTLMAWKKMFEHKQRELIEWQLHVTTEMKGVVEGCLILVDTDSVLGNRMDIINKRLRHIERAIERQIPALNKP